MGYRLSGGMMFKLTEPLAGINDMKLMLRIASGGESITDEEINKLDISCGGKIGAQLMCPLGVGTIGKIEGLEEIKNHPNLVDFIQYYNIGDTVEQKVIGTLGQHFCRITFITNSKEEAIEAINYFQSKLAIYDTNGLRMNNLPFDAGRIG